MRRPDRISLLAAAIMALLCVGVGQAFAEAEYLRLRPPKEPTVGITDSDVKLPQVQAPRINKRRSTIPGVQNPDYGRPRVNTNPRGRGAIPQVQIFGNPAISGN